MSKTHSKTFKCLFFLMLTHFSVQTLLKQRTSELDEAFWVGVSTGLPCYVSVHLSKTPVFLCNTEGIPVEFCLIKPNNYSPEYNPACGCVSCSH